MVQLLQKDSLVIQEGQLTLPYAPAIQSQV